MKFQIAVFLLLTARCTAKYNSSSPLDTLTDQQKEAIVIENADLRLRIESLENRIDSFEMVSMRRSFERKTTNEPYVFILMEVEQNDKNRYGKRARYHQVSDVLEVGDLDRDSEYRLLDRFQSTYMNSPEGLVYQGQVISRKILTFATYEEASKTREKYLLGD